MREAKRNTFKYTSRKAPPDHDRILAECFRAVVSSDVGEP